MVICLAREWLLKWLTNNAVEQEVCCEIRFRFCFNDTMFQSLMDRLWFLLKTVVSRAGNHELLGSPQSWK